MLTSDLPECIRESAIGAISYYLHEFLEEPGGFRGQQLRGGGPVAEFEQLLATRCGFRYCLATCNATTALLALTYIFEVQGRLVLFPSGHWEGSIAAFRLGGARVEEYGEAAPGSIGETCGEAPWAVVRGESEPPAWVQALDCLVVEDSGRLPGYTTVPEARSGADVQILSFGPGKPLSLGEGGALLTNDWGVYSAAVGMTQHPERSIAEGMDADGGAAGMNGRIHPLAALMGCRLLEGRPSWHSED